MAEVGRRECEGDDVVCIRSRSGWSIVFRK